MPQFHANGLNFYEMFLEVRKALNESTASYWTDLEIYSRLNQAQMYIARKAKPLKKTVTVTTVASTQEYSLTTNSFSDIIDIAEDGVYFKINGTTYLPLEYKAKDDLSKETTGWRSVSSSIPQKYYYNKDSKLIGLYPKPNSSNAGAYLDITGYYFPPVLHAGTAVSGTTTTMVIPDGSSTLPYLSKTDDYYNNLYIEIYSGTGAGQRKQITDYVASTRTLTVAFTTAPDSTSIYGMVSPIQPEAHHLMPLYALSFLLKKGGTRTVLARDYWQQFIAELTLFIGETEDNEDEVLIRENYR